MPTDKLHGNRAKIDPKKHVESLYQTNAVTIPDHLEHETPVSSPENAKRARNFSEENKK